MLEMLSHSQLELSRAVPYGGAASCLALLIAITQVQSRAPDVQIVIASAAIALPLWLVQATVYEFYMYLGPRSHSHYKAAFTQLLLKKLGYLAGLSLATGVGALIHCLLSWALWVYLAAILLSFYFLHSFHTNLAVWWHEEQSTATQSKPDEA